MLKAMLGAGVPPISYSDLVLQSSPIGFWPLNEPSGTTAADLVVARNATYNGSPTLQAAGPSSRLPYGATFNGSTQNASTATHSAFNVACNGTWSIEAWVKFTGAGTSIQTFAAWRGTAGGSSNYDETATLSVNNGVAGRIQVNVSNSAANARLVVNSDGGWNDGEWHHVVATAVSGGAMTLYVDGVSRGSTSAARIAGNGSQRRVTAASNAGNPFGQWFAGSIAGLAIYMATLSSDRVAAHYAAGR
jgi:hypothetical protein